MLYFLGGGNYYELNRNRTDVYYSVAVGDMQEVAVSRMADDFVFSGWTPQPLDKGEFLAMHSELKGAMPDYWFHLSDVQEGMRGLRRLFRLRVRRCATLLCLCLGCHLSGTRVLMFLCRRCVQISRLRGIRLQRDARRIGTGGGLTGLLQQIGTELPVLPRLGDSDIKRMNKNRVRRVYSLAILHHSDVMRVLTCGKSGTKAAKNSPDHSVDDEENEGKDDAAGDGSCAHRSFGYASDLDTLEYRSIRKMARSK